jgi:hypothetical protein
MHGRSATGAPSAMRSAPHPASECDPLPHGATCAHAVTSSADCIDDSIAAPRASDDDAAMQDPSPEASAESARLLESARALRAVAGGADPAAARVVLEDVEAMLRATAVACEAMAAAVVPPGGPITDRYRRAAAGRPTAVAPSYERLAALLSALHDTAAGLPVAAARCRRAHDATRSLTRTAEPSPQPARTAMDTAPA